MNRVILKVIGAAIVAAPAVSFAQQPLKEAVYITDEQVKKWYEENQQNYMLPETVNLQYIELTRAQAESTIEVRLRRAAQRVAWSTGSGIRTRAPMPSNMTPDNSRRP